MRRLFVALAGVVVLVCVEQVATGAILIQRQFLDPGDTPEDLPVVMYDEAGGFIVSMGKKPVVGWFIEGIPVRPFGPGGLGDFLYDPETPEMLAAHAKLEDLYHQAVAINHPGGVDAAAGPHISANEFRIGLSSRDDPGATGTQVFTDFHTGPVIDPAKLDYASITPDSINDLFIFRADALFIPGDFDVRGGVSVNMIKMTLSGIIEFSTRAGTSDSHHHFWVTLDEDSWVVPGWVMLTNAQGLYQVDAGTPFGPEYVRNTPPIVSNYSSGPWTSFPTFGEPFYLGFWVDTSEVPGGGDGIPGIGDLFGWALIQEDADGLWLLAAATEIEGYGLYVGTTRQIPEPSTLTLLAIGAFGLLAYTWRRRRREG